MNILSNDFTDKLTPCIDNPEFSVEIFLQNGVRLAGTIKHASPTLIIVGCSSKGNSHINPNAIATYVINYVEPKPNKRKQRLR